MSWEVVDSRTTPSVYDRVADEASDLQLFDDTVQRDGWEYFVRQLPNLPNVAWKHQVHLQKIDNINSNSFNRFSVEQCDER